MFYFKKLKNTIIDFKIVRKFIFHCKMLQNFWSKFGVTFE